jgi:serine/threonine-protein kinase RsbT
VANSSRFSIDGPVDVERARRQGRVLARSVGFGPVDSEAVVLSISELATNLLRYAQCGSILLDVIEEPDRQGVRIESRDTGPGIADIERALRGGYRTAHSLGSGIASVRRLMDDFAIESGPTGTVIVTHKWIAHR